MKIKPVFIVLFFGISTISGKSQREGIVLSHYLFPEFTQGKIRLKSGIIKESNLNYNSITEEMIFESNGKKLAFANPETIDTIFIQDRAFIPVGKAYYEVIVKLPVPLFIRHICTITPPGKPSGYGGTSETGSITSTSSIYTSGGVYEMKLPDDYKVNPSFEFILKKNNSYIRISNINQVIKCFPEKKDAIKEFAKTNNISFKKSEDVISLVIFCNK